MTRTTNPTTSPGFSVADVLAFALTKDADERYNYSDLDHCALAQFFRHKGLEIHSSERNRLERSAIGTAACCRRTFGGFARELERIVEPSLRKRLWARFMGKPIGQPAEPDTPSVWVSPDAYLSDRVRIVANA